MTREEQIQKAKNEAFPIPENGGRCLECACGAGGFEWGAWWADEHPYKEDKMRYCIEYINPRFLLLDNGKLNVRHLRVPDEHWAEMAITLILSFGGKIYALYRGNVVDGKLGEWDTPTIVEPDDWFSEDWFKAISQPSLPSDIDKAAVQAHIRLQDGEGLSFLNIFKAGAEWQKVKMMEGAVEGEVENATFGIVYLRKNLVNEGYSTGDKVKIIVLKEDGK